MANVNAGILGTGHSYPEGILTNADLEKLVDTSDDWITSRTGIKQRRKAAPGEYTSQFAVRASRQRRVGHQDACGAKCGAKADRGQPMATAMAQGWNRTDHVRSLSSKNGSEFKIHSAPERCCGASI